jgi:hypothetical protein
VGSLVLAHHGETLLGDGAHLVGLALLLEIQDRAYVQGAHGCVGVPGAAGSVPGKDFVQTSGILGQVLQAHRAVLDEGHRFTLTLHRHHDVETGFAHFPDCLLESRIGGLDDRIREAEVGHELAEAREPREQIVAVLAGELHQQQRVRGASDEAFDGRAEHGDVAGQLHESAIDQLHGGGLEGDDVLGRLHGLVEARKVADSEHAVRRDRLKVELDLGEEGERSLRAHQQVRHVVAFRVDAVDVVAAHPAQQLWKASLDLGGLTRTETAHALHQVQVTVARGTRIEVSGHIGETGAAAVREQRMDGVHVVHHVAVADGAGTAGVVTRHAADGGAIGGGHVDREEQTVGHESGIELVEDDAGLDPNLSRILVQLNDSVQILADVDDQCLADGLTTL